MNKKTTLIIEFILLFLLFPITLTIIGNQFLPFLLLPLIGIFYYFKEKSLVKKFKSEFEFKKVKGYINNLLLQTIIVFILLFIFMNIFYKESLFSLQKENPLFLVGIFFIYSIISVLPQTFMYRFIFEKKFSQIFTSEKTKTTTAVLTFAFAHIIFLNIISILFTLIAGYLFYTTYRKTESFWISYIQHVLLGYLVFFIGLGNEFI